jgi:hypothetical protein
MQIFFRSMHRGFYICSEEYSPYDPYGPYGPYGPYAPYGPYHQKLQVKFIFIKLFQNLHRLCNNFFFSKDSTRKLITQIILQLSTTPTF